MLKLNFAKLFLVFGVFILILMLLGCDYIGGEKTTDSNRASAIEEFDNNKNQIEMMFINTGFSCDEKIEFRAEPYLQNVALSWSYSLDVKVDNGLVYLNDILYEHITYTDNVDFSYSDAFLLSANGNQELLYTLEIIKNQKEYYVLKTESDSNFNEEIVLVRIDDTYYFLSLYENGEVMRIHSAYVKKEEGK